MTSRLPAFGISGWSGSGKTTLLVEVVRRFTARGLKVAVIKDDIHGPDLDREGKDSDRLFQAGADVVLTAPGESLSRMHAGPSGSLPAEVNRLDPDYDLIFVEGGKAANLARKVWMLRCETETPPQDIAGAVRALRPGEDRLGTVIAMVDEWLGQRVHGTPLCAGILIGGRSERMGQPKHLLRAGDTTWLEHIVATVEPFVRQVVLLGAGEVPPSLRALPALPDVPDKRGPLAGMLAATRWHLDASWLFMACDLPKVSPMSVEWLIGKRAPGVWAILPRLPGAQGVEPLFALYEFRAGRLLECRSAPSELARLPEVKTPEPPSEIASAWANLNTAEDAAGL